MLRCCWTGQPSTQCICSPVDEFSGQSPLFRDAPHQEVTWYRNCVPLNSSDYREVPRATTSSSAFEIEVREFLTKSIVFCWQCTRFHWQVSLNGFNFVMRKKSWYITRKDQHFSNADASCQLWSTNFRLVFKKINLLCRKFSFFTCVSVYRPSFQEKYSFLRINTVIMIVFGFGYLAS